MFELTEAALASRAVTQALAALPEHEFRLRREIVADCTATLGMPMPGAAAEGTRLLVLEILTVAD